MALTAGALTAPEVAREFGDAILYTVRREKRESMTSPLYDLPTRSALGFEVIRATAPDLLRELSRRTTPEEIGQAMREPLMRPYLLQPFILMEGYFVGREQLRIKAELEGRDWTPGVSDDADADLVASWYGRICAGQRADDRVFPNAEVKDHPVLSSDQAAWIAAHATTPESGELERSRAVFGSLELYALTLHGEQRDGICDHGPYKLDDGILVMHEVNDLRNDYLPWSGAEVRLSVDAVGTGRVHDPAGTEFDMFGTMNYTEPNVETRQHCFWIREDDRVRPATLEELEAVAEEARVATSELFKQVAAWEDDYRIAYGGPLFANHLIPFIRVAGDPAIEPPFVGAVSAATSSAMEWIRETTGPLWEHFSTVSDGSGFFRPFDVT